MRSWRRMQTLMAQPGSAMLKRLLSLQYHEVQPEQLHRARQLLQQCLERCESGVDERGASKLSGIQGKSRDRSIKDRNTLSLAFLQAVPRKPKSKQKDLFVRYLEVEVRHR